MAVAFDNPDINGDCFILGTEGEPEVELLTNRVYFPVGSPAATEANIGVRVAYTNNQILIFVKVNTYYLYTSGVPFQDALRISYIRWLAVREGLVSPTFVVNTHHVRYNDAYQMTALDMTAFNNGLTPAHGAAFPNEAAFNAAWAASAAVIDKAAIREVFTDIVCCVAYMFRVRGHHYRDEFAAKYGTLWQRCLHTNAQLPVAWNLLATAATHAIMPDILDNFWAHAALNSRCAGTLIKRFDSAPAGIAGVAALKRGIDDITMIFPTVCDRVPQAKAEFDRVYALVTQDRWAGSINARFYGAARINVNEANFGALASVVVGIYNRLADGSPLLQSLALQRLANIAPATGGAIGAAAAATAKSDRFLLFDDANA